jgi:hypothetical protein
MRHRRFAALAEAVRRSAVDSPPAYEEGDSFWVPAGRRAQVKRYVLPDGMVYLGSDLLSINPAFPTLLEPSLIDPALPILHQHPDRAGEQLPGILSYSEMPAACRAAYLEWLAGGRRDPDVSIGYVILFFYGLERRLFFDASGSAAARAEQDALLAEAERLLTIYDDSERFREQVESFLTAGRLIHRRQFRELFDLPRAVDEPPSLLRLRMALGLHAEMREPLPAEWALIWLLSRTDADLPEAADRHPEAFWQLFLTRYPAAFPGGGLRIRKGRERLTAYQPVSPSFGLASIQLSITEVWSAKAPLQKLRAFAERVAAEIESGAPLVPSRVRLDPEKIREKIVETERAASLLDSIFQEEPLHPILGPPEVPPSPAPTDQRVPGLDAAHARLLQQLAGRPAWPRVEVERLAGALGLLPDGALETLNEVAFERCGVPLLEGYETIEVDAAVLQDLLR